VTLATSTGLPDPRYLKLRTAVCRIAHLSGAMEYVEYYERDVDSRVVLVCDGSSDADILAFSLRMMGG
jgi:hypothetical protein